MDKIVYTEFGFTTEISRYHLVGPKLKGMRNGKPFKMNKLLFVNLGKDLFQIDKVNVRDSKGKVVNLKNMNFDTDQRIAGIIICRGSILLHYNEREEGSFYSFPGGHKREFETEYECLKREILEETGIDISNSKVELLRKIHELGFGPESFYSIEMEDLQFEPIEEVGVNAKTKLLFLETNTALKLRNLYPQVIVNLLENKLLA